MRTSETVTDLGLYDSECCGVELIFDTGDQFLNCPECNCPCVWELEEELVTADEFDHMRSNWWTVAQSLSVENLISRDHRLH